MAELQDSDREELRRIVGEALLSEDEPAGARVAAADVRQVFCDNWQTVKKVLEFIAGIVPGIGRYVRAIIAAGDFLYGRICR